MLDLHVVCHNSRHHIPTDNPADRSRLLAPTSDRHYLVLAGANLDWVLICRKFLLSVVLKAASGAILSLDRHIVAIPIADRTDRTNNSDLALGGSFDRQESF